MEVKCLDKDAEILEFIISGELNTCEVENFQKTIHENLSSNAKALLLDCSQMPYLTSAGLRSICLLGKGLTGKGLKFGICGLTGLAKEIYFISGFHRVFPPAENLEEAKKNLYSILS